MWSRKYFLRFLSDYSADHTDSSLKTVVNTFKDMYAIFFLKRWRFKRGVRTNFSLRYVFVGKSSFFKNFEPISAEIKPTGRKMTILVFFFCPMPPGHRTTAPSVRCPRSSVGCIHSKKNTKELCGKKRMTYSSKLRTCRSEISNICWTSSISYA